MPHPPPTWPPERLFDPPVRRPRHRHRHGQGQGGAQQRGELGPRGRDCSGEQHCEVRGVQGVTDPPEERHLYRTRSRQAHRRSDRVTHTEAPESATKPFKPIASPYDEILNEAVRLRASDLMLRRNTPR